MNNLWSPWRIHYIKQNKIKGCLFCKVYKEMNDKKNFIIFRSKYSFIILNTFPYNNGHLMIVPNQHIKNIEALKNKEIIDIFKNLILAKKILTKTLKPQGFNIGININKVAGAGIDKHLHFHLVPRWLGDTNFMPTISDTKVISQSLNDLYNLLKKCLLEKI